MFPSSNNGNVDPINYQGPFFTDSIPKYQFDPSNFFNLPSPPFCFDDFFQQEQPLNMAKPENNDAKRKSCVKRDRHSKINTAQGPRDRRMRLSLKVAREFFDLQDKLGFDKPSKTVEWLLLQSRPAIKQLYINQGASSPSECEVISGNEEDEPPAAIKDTLKAVKTVPCGVKNKGKKAKPSRKAAFSPQQVKELRKKARAKAIERTRKKIELQGANNQINQLFLIENGEESEAPFTDSQLLTAPENISDESLAAIGKWSPFPVPSFNHLYNPGFPHEQIEMTADFQFCKSMWE